MANIMRKTTILVLAVVMVIGISIFDLGNVAYAGDGPIVVTTAEQLKAELGGYVNRDVVLGNDITLTEAITVNKSSMGLNLNGKSLVLSGNGTIILDGEYARLTVFDEDASGGSSIGKEKGAVVVTNLPAFVVGDKESTNHALLKINNGQFYSTAENGTIIKLNPHPVSNHTDDGLVILDGEFTATGDGAVIDCGSEDNSGGSYITIYRGTFEGEKHAIVAGNYVDAEIRGGSFYVSDGDYALDFSDDMKSPYLPKLFINCTAYKEGASYDEFIDDLGIRPLDRANLGKHKLFQCAETSNAYEEVFLSVNDEDAGYARCLNGPKALVGAPIYFSATAEKCYNFNGWYDKCNMVVSETSTYRSIMPDGPFTLTARFIDGKHNYDEGKILTPGTCIKDGIKEYKCKDCGKTDVSYFMTDHHYVDTVKDPTYIAKGYTLHKCKDCGDSYKDKYTDVKKLAQGKITSVANTSTGITVKWSKVTGATGYQVYRKVGTGSWKLFKTTTSTTVSNTKLSNGTQYQYKVRAIAKNSSGTIVNKGAFSTIKTMYRLNRPTLATGTKNIATQKIVVKWNKNAKASGYQIKYVKGSTVKTVKVAKAAPLSKTLTKLTKGSTYKVSVRSYKTVSGKTYYSAYSAAKSIKVVK